MFIRCTLFAGFCSLFLLSPQHSLGQFDYTLGEIEFSGGKELIMDNSFIRRSLSFSGDSVVARGLWLTDDSLNYLRGGGEFSFLLNGQKVNGYSGWKLLGSERIRDEGGGAGLCLKLQGAGGLEALGLDLNYMYYEGFSLVRKWISFRNGGTEDMKIEALNVEDLETGLSAIHSVVLHNYARMKHLGAYTGDWDDPVLVVHHQGMRRGMAIGNEAPGVMKRTVWHSRQDNIEAGLSHPGQDVPFRKWLAAGESWSSPATFLCLYSGTDDAFAVVDGAVNDFTRRHLQLQIYKKQDKPVFVYNTWNPFRTYVDATLIREVAEAAARCGIQEFIIDDGWQVNEHRRSSGEAWGNNYGDWYVDEEKFPGGLKPSFDHIRSLGMKPGLWISIGSATEDARVFREHPEWFVVNQQGETGNLHSEHDPDFFTSCFGTDWVDYISDVINGLCDEHGLAYAKLDLSVVSSAYVNNSRLNGCYATDHPYHRDHAESLLLIYERLLEFFDRLHRNNPGLFIDCTFETAGKLQMMDYAIARHAEGNWLSNFEEASPTGPLRIRHMAWWRSPAVPAASLVIGNTAMDDPGFEFALQSLIGTLPIVLGDPRALSPEKQDSIRAWSEWMQEMQASYNYMSFRRDLPGFGEPCEGHWDGWMRLNKESRAGGIFGVFRQGAAGQSRLVVLRDLDEEGIYELRLAPGGEVLHAASGSSLMQEGFRVEIPENYGGRIFEVSRR